MAGSDTTLEKCDTAGVVSPNAEEYGAAPTEPSAVPPVTDESLMSAVAAGDLDALGELVRRHQDVAIRLARRLTGDTASADDIAQDAFIRVYRAASRYRPQSRFTTWLYRIIVNLAWDHRRRTRTQIAQSSEQHIAESADPAQDLSLAETQNAVRAAVQSLPHRQRVAIVLHRFEGQSVRQIARITGWSESAVESCLVRAYRQLRRDLAHWGTIQEKKAAG